METTNALTALINKTSDDILDRWTSEAEAASLDVYDYINDQLDVLETTEPEVRMTVGARYLQRIMGVAA